DTTLNEGCRFTLELPSVLVRPPAVQLLRPPDTAPASSPATRPAYHGKLLCIEDNLSSMALIETLLQRRPGIQLLSSMQGQLGLDLARQHAP
ncbi:Sensory box histidine kinase/response regulator, partial [Pseudomonas coronafaciens pv. garcae]